MEAKRAASGSSRRGAVMSTVAASAICLISVTFLALSSASDLRGEGILGLQWQKSARSAFVATGGSHSSIFMPSLKSTCPVQRILVPEPAKRAAGFLSGLVAQYRGRGGGSRGGGGGGGGSRGRRFMPPPTVKGPMMNSEIPFPEMRVVVANPEGKDIMLGVLSRSDALREADERGVDLVVISPDAVPPVCKIINYDKLRYENEKKEKMKKKNQKNSELKEVKLSYKIDVHDYEVRKRAALRFLLKGDKVKASIRFRGREMAHKDLAQKTLNELCEDCAQVASVEKKPSMEGRMMQVIMAPLPEAMKAAEKAREASKRARMSDKNKARSKVLTEITAGMSATALAEQLGLDDEDDDDLEALNNELSNGDDEDDDEDADESSCTEVQFAQGDSEEDDASAEYDLDSLSISDLGNLINEVGARIRRMKDAGEHKDVFAPSVDELLALKARYQELAGTPWSAPAQK